MQVNMKKKNQRMWIKTQRKKNISIYLDECLPVAPKGWPLDMSPPLGFTTYLPP